MMNRRSIFKCIPAMLAAAFLPKAWRVKAAEPVVGQAMLMSGPGQTYVCPDTTVISKSYFQISEAEFGKNEWKHGPIRIFVDDQYGGTAELTRAISAEFALE